MKQAARHVRHKSGLALVLIDVINHFEFPDGKSILRQALAIAPALARLRESAMEAVKSQHWDQFDARPPDASMPLCFNHLGMRALARNFSQLIVSLASS